MFRKVNDFDGDGKADFAVTRNVGATKYWYLWQSRDGFRASAFGINTDQNAAGDYDGDGRADIAVFRKEPISSTTMRYSFWIIQSQSGVRTYISETNSYPDAVAHQQDYDGDGKTDFARTIENNTGFYFDYSIHGGGSSYSLGATPIKIGDTNGDGSAEVASYNSNTQTVSVLNQSIRFGSAGDIFVTADFDGDAKGDITIFRPSDGTWWWIRSSDGAVNVAQWGQAGDAPVPADYDGDGKTDLAIYRPGSAQSPQSYYWVYGSLNGVSVLNWGLAGDAAVTY
jgi:hypothetical protein